MVITNYDIHFNNVNTYILKLMLNIFFFILTFKGYWQTTKNALKKNSLTIKKLHIITTYGDFDFQTVNRFIIKDGTFCYGIQILLQRNIGQLE